MLIYYLEGFLTLLIVVNLVLVTLNGRLLRELRRERE
jgi:hypothetical protein